MARKPQPPEGTQSCLQYRNQAYRLLGGMAIHRPMRRWLVVEPDQMR